MEHTIRSIQTHVVTAPPPAGLADSTRAIGRLGYLIVRVSTDTGLEGIGVTYYETGGDATRELIVRELTPYLEGRDALQTETLWHEQAAFLRGVGRKGVSFCAISAVDIALWDLKGKAFGLPIHRLLGGARTKVPVYASGGWTSYSDDELVAEALGMVDAGYRTIKVKVGVDRGTAPLRDLARIGKVREAVGPQVGIMLDANNCWRAATAARFANVVKDLDVLFLEEPVPADDLPGLARFRAATDLPLATGEHEYTKFGVRDLLVNGAVDVLQVDAARTGGFTEMVKIVGMAQAWNVAVAPHGMDFLHLQLAGAYADVPYAERLLMFDELTTRTFVNAPAQVDGFLGVPDSPGLGLVLDMDYVTHNEREA